MNSELTNVVESAEAERLATGFVFTEGPLWHPDGYWLFVDVRASLIYRLSTGGQPEVIREHSGGSNGMTFDLQGRRLICEGDNRQVTRPEPDGTYTPLAQRLGDKRINRPNDIVTRSDGSIYFTDPAGRLPQAERELDFSGVHRIAPDGTLSNATSETEYPNGLAFSPDERVLYVAITRRDDGCIAEKERGEVCTHQFIRAFDVAPDGTLSNNRIFAEMFSASDGVPDGMKVDVEGRVYCTGSEGCWVFDASGNHLGMIRLPEIPANCAWGGPDHRTMLFTARTSVYTLRMKTPGTRIPGTA
ncbi:SMP-30/gluconolactonase/LRE family protein [Candidatus Entotheonella palauensis]|uniref:SMP-30/gluconolactonase/LRE family protein n=1 Tax=Candidatus Entotheonella palauensis TaxID=93172 RepID=UPI0021182DD4|nr:SMP-30/gluconolactonase/LRE family protein [Candidatus Entotheonella palauensis]